MTVTPDSFAGLTASQEPCDQHPTRGSSCEKTFTGSYRAQLPNALPQQKHVLPEAIVTPNTEVSVLYGGCLSYDFHHVSDMFLLIGSFW